MSLYEESNGVAIITDHYEMDRSSPVTVLQRTHINLLRKAEYLNFRHLKNNVPAHIQGHVKSKVQGIGTVEKDIYIVVSDSTITNYGRWRDADGGFKPARRTYASHLLLYANQHDQPWRTIVGLLRVGDTLELAWTADNNNLILDEANLHADSLELLVNRKGKPKYRFLIAREVALDNTARMCQAF